MFIGPGAANIATTSPLPGKVNYFIGSDSSKWHPGVPTYAGIVYRGLYPGIDLAYSGSGGLLKGTYTVASGADPSRIRWRYEGGQVTVDSNGNLLIRVEGDITLTEQAPVAWQEVKGQRVNVSARYQVAADGSLSFVLGNYDHSKTLTLDPTLIYSSYLGGSVEDGAKGIGLDGSGNIYVTGYTYSLNFPLANPIQPVRGGVGDVADAFVSKLDPTGSTLIYSTYLGGSYTDDPQHMVVDTTGNAYVVGSTSSSDFPTTPGAYQRVFRGNADAFLTKLNPNGSALVYSTYLGGRDGPFGGSGDETGYGVAIDAQGNAYITGSTSSLDFPTANPVQPTFGGGYTDAFATKFNASGSALVYSTYLGGGGNMTYEWGDRIAVDSTGNAFVTGRTASTDFPLANAFQPTHGGGELDAFVTKLAPAGSSLVYSTYLGGNDDDEGWGIGVDAAGNAYVAGHTASTNFPLANPFQPTFGGSQYDAFVTKLAPTGSSLVYSTYLGGNSSEHCWDLSLTSAGNVYVIGSTYSTNFPMANPIQPVNNGLSDLFITKLAPGGATLNYSTYLGGSGIDEGWAITADTQGNVYIAGKSSSTDFPLVNPRQPTNAGISDAVVVKISDQGPPTPTFTPRSTRTPTNTPTPCPKCPTPTATATPCPITFTDVQPSDYFYEPVRYLYCRGVISGYGDGTFKPYNLTTRGQLAKIVVLAEGWPIYTPPAPTFRDVLTTDPFYTFIETAYHRGIISGYVCGPGCLEYRPGNNVTRAQLCKIIVLAEGWPVITPTDPTFIDVPNTDPFYGLIETAYDRGIIAGYNCGSNCLEFRPGNNATRGQICKIVYLAVIQP